MAELVRQLADEQISRYTHNLYKGHNFLRFKSYNSLSIPGAQPDLHNYADMLPAIPRIIDPVNLANNVYLSGVGPDPYEVGVNDWGTFKRKVATIDLTIHPC